MTSARIVSVNVGLPRTAPWDGRGVRSGIWKLPVAGRVGLLAAGLEGDGQADRRFHGAPDKAVYAYAAEDYAFWAGALGRALEPGTFGENLTVEGLDFAAVAAGDRWRVGTAMVEVTSPRTPCYKLGMRMGDGSFPERFGDAGRLGWYLRVLRDGEVGAGDPVEVLR